jgi:hypothetical protein
VTIHRSHERLFRKLARALAIGGVAFSLAPAAADARPARGAQDEAAQEHVSLHWGTATLAGGAVALLVVGALGVAAADDRRYLPTSG